MVPQTLKCRSPRIPFQFPHPLQVPAFHPPEALLRLGQQPQGFEGRGAAQGIGGVGMPVVEGQARGLAAEGLVDFLGAGRHRQGQESSGYSLGEADEVGRSSRPVAGKPLPGASESHHHLIPDGQDPVLAKQEFHLAQVRPPAHPHAPGSLDEWFHDHGPVAIPILPQQVFEVLQ